MAALGPLHPNEVNMSAVYNRDEIALMKSALDEAWQALPAEKKDNASRVDMACVLLDAAARGERNPEKLKQAALRLGAAPISGL
jgi:hypothetical protein